MPDCTASFSATRPLYLRSSEGFEDRRQVYSDRQCRTSRSRIGGVYEYDGTIKRPQPFSVLIKSGMGHAAEGKWNERTDVGRSAEDVWLSFMGSTYCLKRGADGRGFPAPDRGNSESHRLFCDQWPRWQDPGLHNRRMDGSFRKSGSKMN